MLLRQYRMPKVSKDVFKFSFFPRSITEWNALPADLPNANLHRYTDLKYTYNRWKYDSYKMWTLYKTMESRRL